MKRPIIVEFSGLPNSGKTTLLKNIDKMCKDNDVKAIIMQEPAELFPTTIPKGSIEQNLWISHWKRLVRSIMFFQICCI